MALFIVKVALDKEAGVWYVADSDVPGLATEAETFDRLREKVLAMVPELLELNGFDPDDGSVDEVPVEIIAHSMNRVRLAVA